MAAEPTSDKPAKSVLIAILKDKRDYTFAHKQHWYRIPVKSAPRIVRDLSVEQVAFYLPKVFEEQAYSVRVFAPVKRIRIVKRKELIPEELLDPRSEEDYFKIELGSLKMLPAPIPSKRQRRIVFIETTPSRLYHAKELNDLYHESPLEEELWDAFKSEHIDAERQFFIGAKGSRYCLDFALFCVRRNIDIECDGDKFHLQPTRVRKDKRRSNTLESLGWSVLRYSGGDIFTHLPDTVQQVKETIEVSGGLLAVGKENAIWSAKQ